MYIPEESLIVLGFIKYHITFLSFNCLFEAIFYYWTAQLITQVSNYMHWTKGMRSYVSAFSILCINSRAGEQSLTFFSFLFISTKSNFHKKFRTVKVLNLVSRENCMISLMLCHLPSRSNQTIVLANDMISLCYGCNCSNLFLVKLFYRIFQEVFQI